METFRLEELYDLLTASTLADPEPPVAGRARPLLVRRDGSPPYSMCRMDDVVVDRDGNPID